MKITKEKLKQIIKEEMDIYEDDSPDLGYGGMSPDDKFRDEAMHAIDTLSEALEFIQSIKDGSSGIRNYDSEEMMRLGRMMHESAEIVEDMAQLFPDGHVASEPSDEPAMRNMRESRRRTKRNRRIRRNTK
jgi:hypothetical protein